MKVLYPIALQVDAKSLAIQVDRVRILGYAFSRHTYQHGVGIIAMPVPHLVGGRWCALGAAGTVDELDRMEPVIAAELRAVIAELNS